MKTREEKTIARYGEALCRDAFALHTGPEGYGTCGVAAMLDVRTNTADALIDAGRWLHQKERAAQVQS